MSINKTALLTGSTGGIGTEIARTFAANGWDLILLNRSPGRTEKQIKELKRIGPDQAFHSYTADMMDLSEVGKAAEEIGANHPELSALYNIAGILTDQRFTNAQGIEGHFAVNTVAPYLMIRRLRRQLGSGSSANQKSVVVNFSSSAVKSVKKLEVSKLINPDKIGGLMGAYAESKLAITMVTGMLKEELSDEGILIHSVDPGPTKTSMTGSGDGMPLFVRLLRPLFFKSPEVQAKKLVSAVDAGVSEGASGIFISEGKRKAAHSLVSDSELQSELRKLLDSQIEKFL